MSFRTNLQYLRAERHMTQEQLAMLLGVSRQSVTKWEAEKAYPEMDKLIKICQIFECSLDDLVQGDVTQRGGRGGRGIMRSASASSVQEGSVAHDQEGASSTAGSPEVALGSTASVRTASFAPAVPDGPTMDICGYDEHMTSLARKIAAGVTCMILGLAASIFADEVMHGEAIVPMVLFAFVAVGLAFIIPTSMEHAAFKKAHPYIADFYTTEQKQVARRRAAVAIVAGIALILAGVAAPGLLNVESNVRSYGGPLMMVLVALGVGAIVCWGMLWGRTNVADYNKEWLETVELGEDELLQLDPQSRETYLRAKDSRRRRAASRRGKACAVIMILATMVALVWLFVGYVLGTSDGIGGLFWLPWVVGSLGTAIVLVVVDDDEDGLPVSKSDEER